MPLLLILVLFFDVLLTVHLRIILAINQFNAKMFFYNKFIIRLYMFRALCAHHQRSKLYYTASGIITLKQVSVTIPDAV